MGYSTLSPVGSGGLVGAGVASPDAVKDTRLSMEREMGISMAMSGSGGAENRSEKPPPVFGTSDVALGSGSIDLSEGVLVSSTQGGLGFGGSGLDGGGPGLGGADGLPGGGGGLPGGAGRGGGGFAGATSRLREISSSSWKLS